MTRVKKVSGIKRHVMVDTQGLRWRCSPGQVQSLLCDSACAGEPFAQGVQAIPGEHVTVRIAGRSELHAFLAFLATLLRRP